MLLAGSAATDMRVYEEDCLLVRGGEAMDWMLVHE